MALLGCFGIAVCDLFRGIIFGGRPINMAGDAFSGGKLQQANLALNPAYVTYRESRNRLNQDMLEYVSVQELNEFVQQNQIFFVVKPSSATDR